jgi:hypothetical protein
VIQWNQKKRTCKAPGCKCRFLAEKQHVWWCSPDCGTQIALAKLAKAREAKAKKERAEHRARKNALQRPRDVKASTQDDFNAMIRERDHDQPCPSCGRFDHQIPEHHTGGKWDCGHFLSRGSHPELAFEPLNAHKQCKQCNRDKSSNAGKYRLGLIERIGLEAVEWLEGPHEPKRYTVEQLREMAANFRAERRRMKREREQRGMV